MITAWLGAWLLVVGVLVLTKSLGVIARSRRVLAIAQESLVTIGDRALDDEAKEQRLQRNALRLFGLFGRLLLMGGAAFGLPLVLLWWADRLGLLPWDRVMAVALSAPFLLSVLAVSVLVALALRRRPGRKGAATVEAEEGSFANRYSSTDRWLHYVAFASTPVQVVLAKAEDHLYRRRLREVAAGPPVFIAGLPRAGTTVLLNMCSAVGEFQTHTYRQMPFVLTPLLWESFSRRFRVQEVAQERAHGDGLTVSADSPEALEEMLWATFWPEHYRPDRIRPWRREEPGGEFQEFFRRHRHKLVWLGRGTDRGPAGRYVSKNNGNIARVDWLVSALPEARVVIPFRAPLAHAFSLWRQHRNFLALHQQDPFARHYMAALGHFDFGANLRPVDFDGWLDSVGPLRPDRLDFWLAYWTAAYGHLRQRVGERVRLLDFDELCHEPEPGLAALADFLQLERPERLVAQARTLRPPRQPDDSAAAVSPERLQAAEELHAALLVQAKQAVMSRPTRT